MVERIESSLTQARLCLASKGRAPNSTAMTGAEFKALRKKVGLSLSQAARQLEVSARTLARWETQETVPPGAVKLFKLENKIS